MSKALYKRFYSTDSNTLNCLQKRRKCLKKKVRLNNETDFKKDDYDCPPLENIKLFFSYK